MRSASEAIPSHLRLLERNADLVAGVYNSGKIEGVGDNRRDINALVQSSILVEADDGQYRVSRDLKRHFDALLRRRRNFAAGTNIKGQIDSLHQLAQTVELAGREGREELRLNHAEDFEDLVSEVAQEMDMTLSHLRALVDSEFGDVSSFSEKTRQNDHYLSRIAELVDSFALIEGAPVAHLVRESALLDQQARIYRRQLINRLPAWRSAFMDIADVLRQHVHALRRVEPKARILHRIAFHLLNDRTYDPPDAPPEAIPLLDWMRLAAPVEIAPHPKVGDPTQDDILVQIARTIPPESNRMRPERQAGGLLDEADLPEEIEIPTPAWRRSYHAMLASCSLQPEVSATAWHALHPVEGVPIDMWLLYLHAITSTSGDEWPYRVRVEHEAHDDRAGVLWIKDVVVWKPR